MAQFSYIYGQSAGKAFALRSERQFILMAEDKVEKWSENKTKHFKFGQLKNEKKTHNLTHLDAAFITTL